MENNIAKTVISHLQSSVKAIEVKQSDLADSKHALEVAIDVQAKLYNICPACLGSGSVTNKSYYDKQLTQPAPDKQKMCAQCKGKGTYNDV